MKKLLFVVAILISGQVTQPMKLVSCSEIEAELNKVEEQILAQAKITYFENDQVTTYCARLERIKSKGTASSKCYNFRKKNGEYWGENSTEEMSMSSKRVWQNNRLMQHSQTDLKKRFNRLAQIYQERKVAEEKQTEVQPVA